MDPLDVVFVVVIAACLPLIAYLLPQDPAMERRLDGLGSWRRDRRLRRRVQQQHTDHRRSIL